jgi:hypothetical protein
MLVRFRHDNRVLNFALPDRAPLFFPVLQSIDPTQRPTFAEMKGHPFFSGVDWAAVFQTPPPASIHRVRAPQFN